MARTPGFSAGAVAPGVPDVVADGSLAIAGPLRSSVVRPAAKRTAACFMVDTSLLTRPSCIEGATLVPASLYVRTDSKGRKNERISNAQNLPSDSSGLHFL